MIVLLTLAAAALAVVLSEIAGRGRVVYTRMVALVGSYLVSCLAMGAVAMRTGGTWVDAAAITLSAVPMMAAWLGFRIHLSNSVTLEMVTLLEGKGPQTAEQMMAAYDPHGHTATRLRILREAGYLVGPDDRVTDGPKGQGVLRLIGVLCGPRGPRAVVAMLERLGHDGR